MSSEGGFLKKLDFVLPIPVDSKYSLNTIYAGMHWCKRNKIVKKLHEFIRLNMAQARIPKKQFEKPVRISFCWNTLLDLDNHGYIAKVIIDSLKDYLIHDDSKKYVKEITHAYWLGEGVRIEIQEIQ